MDIFQQEKQESSTEDIADHMKHLSINKSYILASYEMTTAASSLDEKWFLAVAVSHCVEKVHIVTG